MRSIASVFFFMHVYGEISTVPSRLTLALTVTDRVDDGKLHVPRLGSFQRYSATNALFVPPHDQVQVPYDILYIMQ